jgi:hypothetical protein
VVMGQPVLSKSGEKQSWNWRGPALTISARPWRVTHTKAQAPGRHLVTVTTHRREGHFVPLSAGGGIGPKDGNLKLTRRGNRHTAQVSWRRRHVPMAR